MKMAIYKHVFLVSTLLLMIAGPCGAETWDFELSAGGSSLSGGVHYRSYLDTGYLRFGGSGVWTDENSTEYHWGAIDFMVGSDTLRPGLTCELGLRGLVGEAKNSGQSGDLGAVGFAGMANYLFSRDVLIIPIEIFGGLTWAPSLLTFRDSDGYTEVTLGAGVRIIKNASIIVSYANYRLEMETGSTSWTLDNDTLRVGLVMRF